MELVVRLRSQEKRESENLKLTFVGHLWGGLTPLSFVHFLTLPMAAIL